MLRAANLPVREGLVRERSDFILPCTQRPAGDSRGRDELETIPVEGPCRPFEYHVVRAYEVGPTTAKRMPDTLSRFGCSFERSLEISDELFMRTAAQLHATACADQLA